VMVLNPYDTADKAPAPGTLRVFESAAALGALVVAQYALVLTQAPQEDVLVTAVPTPPKKEEADEGKKGIGLKLRSTEANLRGVTAVFTRDDWFIPHVITVTAPDDHLAEGGVREYVIQHTVMQGNSADDGDPYDHLNVPSVVAQVYDSTSAAVAV